VRFRSQHRVGQEVDGPVEAKLRGIDDA